MLRDVVDVGQPHLPHVGAILATTIGQEAHEWSQIESGVFTHELLSALVGPADVNQDGRIEYTEVQAFIASANREVKDPRAIPRVIAHPPAINRNVALVTTGALGEVVMLEGDPSRLGHFHVELENGQRYMDANLGEMTQTQIVIPRDALAFLRTEDGEAQMRPGEMPSIALDELRFVKRPVSARGSIDAAYRTALFASAFGPTYYEGFVDSIGAVGARFDGSRDNNQERQVETAGKSEQREEERVRSPEPAEPNTEVAAAPIPSEPFDPPKPPAPFRKPTAIVLFALGGASLVTAGVSFGLMAEAKSNFDATDKQEPAREASQRYEQFSALGILAGVVALAGGISGWLFWPPSTDFPPAAVVPSTDGASFALTLSGAW